MTSLGLVALLICCFFLSAATFNVSVKDEEVGAVNGSLSLQNITPFSRDQIIAFANMSHNAYFRDSNRIGWKETSDFKMVQPKCLFANFIG